MPPLMDVMTALLLSFTIGLGLSYINGTVLHDAFTDFKEIINLLIRSVIIPLLPIHIFGIFLNMTVSGQVMTVIAMFLKVIIVIFILHAYSKLLLRRVPEQYDTNASTVYGKVQCVLDYISGMTDVYALDLYRKITGMSLPAV